MEATNYISIELEKPMGIVFEENDESKFGGIYVVSMSEGGNAEKSGVLLTGDQLVAVGTTNVAGQSFDDALGAIVASDAPKTKLVLFRGSAQNMYGPTGASKDWLQEFIDSGAAQA
jgi:C-terminal processing protease CtpA/Prc